MQKKIRISLSIAAAVLPSVKIKHIPTIGLVFLSAAASASEWKTDWTNQSKFLTESNNGLIHYFTSYIIKPDGYADYNVGFAEVDAGLTPCALVYEKKSGFFTNRMLNGYFISLSSIEKIESRGHKNVDGEILATELYTLKDGTKIETLKFDQSGIVYACSKNEKGEITGKALKWTRLSNLDGNEPCAFNDVAANKMTFKPQNVIAYSKKADVREVLGFNSMPIGFSQKIEYGASAKALYEKCIIGEGKLREYRQHHAEFVKSVINDYKAENGDPVAEVQAKWVKAFGSSPSKKSPTDLVQQIGLVASDFSKENLPKVTLPNNVTLPDLNMTYFAEYDVCENAKYYSGDLSGAGIKGRANKVIACLTKEGGLERLDVTMPDYYGRFEDLSKKFQLIDKTLNKGQSFVDQAIFTSGNMVVRYKEYDGGESNSRFALNSYSKMTFMTKEKFMKIQLARAEMKLHQAAQSWFEAKTAK